MDEKDLTKKVLIEVAKDLSKIFEQPIETADDKTDIDLLKKDLIEAGNELQEGDSLADESKDVLITLGVKLPGKVEAKEEAVKPVKQKATAKKAKAEPVDKKKAPDKKEKEKVASKKKAVDKKAEKVKPVEKEAKKSLKKYTRAQAFCDALQGKPKTIEEIAKMAISLYEEKTGKFDTQIKTAIWNVTLSLQPLLILGFVEKTDKKYSLK